MPTTNDAPGLLADRWQDEEGRRVIARRGKFYASIYRTRQGTFQAHARHWGTLEWSQPFPDLPSAQAACEEAARGYLAELRAENANWPEE